MNLLNEFQQHFELVKASSPRLLGEVYWLRKQVFEIENQYESHRSAVDESPIDPYEHRSVSCLLNHRRTGHAAATVRLVLPATADKNYWFPAEDLFENQLLQSGFEIPENYRETTAELSRLAVSKRFRNRPGEAQVSHGMVMNHPLESTPSENQRRSHPFIILGLLRGAIQLSKENGIKHWLVGMDTPFIRALRYFGMDFYRICQPIEHLGSQRVLCWNDLDQILTGVKKIRPDVFRFLNSDGFDEPVEPDFMIPTSVPKVGRKAPELYSAEFFQRRRWENRQ